MVQGFREVSQHYTLKIKVYFQQCNAKASVTQHPEHRTIASSPFGTFTSRKSFLLDRPQIC